MNGLQNLKVSLTKNGFNKIGDVLAQVPANQLLANDAKLGHVTPHDLRHTCLMNFLMAGVDPATAASLLRHSLDTALKIYFRLTPHGKADALKRARTWRTG
jgi:integrase